MIGIIPAAGAGTRFKELGKQYSKTILPYKEKPILIHQIEWMERHGCSEIRVILNHQEDTVKDILRFYNKNVIIKHQKMRNGLSGAIFAGLNESDKGNVLVLLGDLVVDQDIDKDCFKHNFISVQEVPDYSRWCMVSTHDNYIKFYDKPTERPSTNKAVSGIYFFTNANELFNALNKQLIMDDTKINDEFQISTVLQWIADNSGMNTIDVKLIDFGTLEEYLENRSVKISRSFNNIEVSGSFITKSSEKEREKLIKEYNWFTNLPDEIAVMTPRLFSKDLFSKCAWYKMQKILAPSIREIYLFIDSTEETWDEIFNSMFDTLHTMEKFGQENAFMKTVVQKTKDRIKNIEIPIENKIVNEFIKEFEDNIGTFNRPALMHGDFCFSNLLYDLGSNKLSMIDPRGELFGDHYYEMAKIFHSILFDYDFIDAELYVKENNVYKLYNNGKENIKELFRKKINKYYTEKEIKYILLITASLFLSMIPLHTHNRNNQEIYYDIFKNIYKEYKEQ